MMKQISTVRFEAPRNHGVLRRCESRIATPGRSGLQINRCAGRSILPEWIWIFLTLISQALPAKWVWDPPWGGFWTRLAKPGQNWPNVDTVGQIWTRLAKFGQPLDSFFPPLCGAGNSRRSVKQKRPPCFWPVCAVQTVIVRSVAGMKRRKSAPKNPLCPRLARRCRRSIRDQACPTANGTKIG